MSKNKKRRWYHPKPKITYVKCINCKRLYSTLEYKYVCRRCILTEDEVNSNRLCNKFEHK